MSTIFSIGYAGRSLDDFLQLLHKHRVEFLIDVRSAPYSKVHPEFSQSSLRTALKMSNIAYVFMGKELGGRPEDMTCYTPDGKIDYEKVKTKEFYQQGIERLITASTSEHSVALMCSELKPQECHRAKLIGETLSALNIPVQHIDEAGNLKDQQAVIDAILDKPYRGGQISMFDEPASVRVFTSRKSYLSDDHSPSE